MSCYESNVASPNFANCATEAGIPSETRAAIQTCAATGSSEGDAIEVANAKATIALGNSKLGTPWVVVNGNYLDDPDTLLQTVCNEYKGKTPAGCN